jgi:hypothetical protein
MLRCEEYDLKKLSPEERQSLARQIYPVIEAIHSCETIDDFVSEFNAECWAMSMAVYRDDSRVVAYARYRISDLLIDDTSYKIVRMDISIDPQYKGKIPYKRFYFKEALRLREVLREKNLYALCLCLSPVPYYYIATYYREVFPHPSLLSGPQSGSRQALLQRFLEASSLRSLPEKPYVVKLLSQGFVETEDERERWERHPSPYVAFYRQQCPNYTQGEALVAIVHLTASRLVVGLCRMLLDRLRRYALPRRMVKRS